jgi:hypothetical protein
VEIETAGGNSRKVTGLNAAKALRNLAFSGARVRKSANLTAQNLTTATAVTWNQEDFDTDSYHDTGSNTDRVTCAEAGYYAFTAYLKLPNTATGNFVQVQINRYNSANVFQEVITRNSTELSVTGTFEINCHSGPVNMAAGDFCRVFATVEADTSVDIDVASFFAVARLG